MGTRSGAFDGKRHEFVRHMPHTAVYLLFCGISCVTRASHMRHTDAAHGRGDAETRRRVSLCVRSPRTRPTGRLKGMEHMPDKEVTIICPLRVKLNEKY